jgi:hypothetical protein
LRKALRKKIIDLEVFLAHIVGSSPMGAPAAGRGAIPHHPSQEVFMRKCAVASLALVAVLSFLHPQQVSAQSIFVGAGITVPTGDFKDFGDGDGAKTGVMATGGVIFPISEEGLSFFGEGYFGVNKHDYEGDKTNLYGLMGGLEYDFSPQGAAGLYAYGEAGFMVHSYKSDTFTDEEGSDTGLAFGGGVGYGIPIGSATGWAEGKYMFGKFDGGNTTFFGIFAGIAFPIG